MPRRRRPIPSRATVFASCYAGDVSETRTFDTALANLHGEIGRDIATVTWRIIGAGIAITGIAVAVLRFLG